MVWQLHMKIIREKAMNDKGWSLTLTLVSDQVSQSQMSDEEKNKK